MPDEVKLRAYTVQGDEHGCVIFAKSHVEARRMGAQELDGDFMDVESCKLAPEFDQYAPGPVPIEVLIDHGWWYECSGCGRNVDADGEDYEDEEETIPLVPVFVGTRHVYCSQSCLDRENERKATEKANKESIIAEAKAIWPEIEIIWTACYGEPHLIDFHFPGGLYGVRWERGAKTVMVTLADQEAWNTYTDEVKARNKVA